eukprot:6197588-Pleurochrysis_carterae.AAC.2
MSLVKEKRGSDVTPVGWVLEKVLSACVARGARKRCGSLHEEVSLFEFTTGGGPPSGTFAAKNRLTEKVEHGGDATMAA